MIDPIEHTNFSRDAYGLLYDNHEIWKKEFKKLDDDIDRFLIDFQKTKTCTCKIMECTHYERKRNKIFGTKIDELYDKKMHNGFLVFQEMGKLK